VIDGPSNKPERSFGIGESAAIVESVAQRVTPSGSSPNAVDALNDLRLANDVVEDLEPPFTELGMRLRTEQLVDPYGSCREATVAVNGVVRLYLLNVPQWILEDTSNASLSAVGHLQHSFDGGGRVFVMSEPLDAPAWSYEHMLGTIWKRSGITASFVPWKRVNEFRALPREQQVRMLRDVFALDQVGQPDTGVRFQQAEFDAIVAELIDQAAVAVEAKDYFGNLVKSLGIPNSWSGEVAARWTGNSNDDARTLVDWAITKGSYPPASQRKGSKVIGYLLRQVCEGAFSPRVQSIGRLIIHYELITDAPTLDDLRTKLDLR
jgi:hypothetical protein